MKSKDTKHLYAMSDIHFDSVKCDLNLLAKHLSLAAETKSPVLIGGDLFDVMQSHDDPRRSLEELQSEYKHDSYLDLVVLDAANFLSKFNVPYIIGMGNHEAAVLRKNNTNLIERLVYALNTGGGEAYSMGYWGFIRLMFQYEKGDERCSRTLYWHHGFGASAPVTRGVIDTARQAAYLPDADVVINGHNHQEYVVTLNRIRLTKLGAPYEQYQHFVRTPGYKKAGLVHGDKFGFDIEKMPAPTTRGCVRLDFTFSHGSKVENVLEICPVALLS
jgi:hypothetical protein